MSFFLCFLQSKKQRKNKGKRQYATSAPSARSLTEGAEVKGGASGQGEARGDKVKSKGSEKQRKNKNFIALLPLALG
jgi:hypothetical protein